MGTFIITNLYLLFQSPYGDLVSGKLVGLPSLRGVVAFQSPYGDLVSGKSPPSSSKLGKSMMFQSPYGDLVSGKHYAISFS